MSLHKKCNFEYCSWNSLTQLTLVFVLQCNGELNLTVNPYTIRLSTLKHLSYLHFVCYVITLECNAVSAIFRMWQPKKNFICHSFRSLFFTLDITLCCKSIRSSAFLWCKMPMFWRAGMREGGKPLPLAFQYLIFMV